MKSDCPNPASSALGSAPEGANHQWRKNPPGELSIDPVAVERLVRVTAWVGVLVTKVACGRLSEPASRNVSEASEGPVPQSTMKRVAPASHRTRCGDLASSGACQLFPVESAVRVSSSCSITRLPDMT